MTIYSRLPARARNYIMYALRLTSSEIEKLDDAKICARLSALIDAGLDFTKYRNCGKVTKEHIKNYINSTPPL